MLVELRTHGEIVDLLGPIPVVDLQLLETILELAQLLLALRDGLRRVVHDAVHGLRLLVCTKLIEQRHELLVLAALGSDCTQQQRGGEKRSGAAAHATGEQIHSLSPAAGFRCSSKKSSIFWYANRV